MTSPDLKDAGMLKEWWALPAYVGLMGFGTTTMLTGLHNVGWWGGGPTMAMAVAFGGTAQFIAGLVALRRGNFFGGSAFIGYGAFWWALFLLAVVLPKLGIESAGPEMAAFFGVWALYTLPFCLCAHKHAKFLAVLFWFLFVAFLLLVGTELGKVPKVLTGWEIFVTGFIAWYIATAELVNAETGKKVLPLA
jgi:succinate-acetate transporter protein